MKAPGPVGGGRTRRFALVVAVVVGAVLLSACSQWAYVLGDQPSASSYTPTASFSAKSTSAPTTIDRIDVGLYVVHFTGLTSPGGTVQVAPAGSIDAICTVESWIVVAGGIDATVACFGNTGTPRDTVFAATFAAPQSSVFPYAHVWADNANASVGVPYGPASSYSFNSAGGANMVTHTGTGSYSVLLPGLYGGDLGNVKVTAYATTAIICNPTSLGPDGNQRLTITVQCATSAGTATDAQFTLTWTTQNLLGVSRPSAHIAVFTAGLPGGTVSTYNSTGGTNTVTETSVGVFNVRFGGLANSNGNVAAQDFAGLAGTGATGNCTVASWATDSTDILADVRCFDTSGTPANPIVLVAFYAR